jgi:polysaccharide export outer membrane protein
MLRLTTTANLTRKLNTVAAKAAVIALFAMLTGCVAPAGGPPPDAGMDVTGFAEEYLIGVGDNLRIEVWRNPDLSVSVPVRPDGKISVPLAGDVLVGGKTPTTVSADLTKSLSTYIRDPFVTVIVTNTGSSDYRNRVRVTGAVNSPLSQPYRPGMTVLDMVLEAGGTNEFASMSRTVLYRASGDRIEIRLDRILRRGDMSTNYTLQPGDVITVPERVF